jgi:YHS domain-containing protein
MTPGPDPLPPPARAADAVCAREVSPREGGLPAPVLYRGQRWWFCSADCRRAFKREPERWADARPDAGEPTEPDVPRPSRPPSPFRVIGPGRRG